MKKTTIIAILLSLSTALGLQAQEYHLGQLVTNPDGSQGVVFYLNEDGTAGWMVALHDVAANIPWGLTDEIEGLPHIISPNNDILTSAFTDTDGFSNTMAILNHYQSTGYTGQYAAATIDIANGWYLPAAGQLKMLYVNAIFYEPTLTSVGEPLGLHPYWSSTQENNERAWFVHFGSPYPEEAWAWNAYIGKCQKTNTVPTYGGTFSVRAIRDLEFSPFPFIGFLHDPAPICDEGPLELTLPTLYNINDYGWEISQDETFTNPIAYTSQILDGTYDGWYLRLWATSEDGTIYSNLVRISVHESSFSNTVASNCVSYTWNGQTYFDSGIYQVTLVNQWGCDSIATLDLTINQPDEYFVPYPIYACNFYEWGDMILTESGAYQQVFTNQYGCDSTVTMSLYITQSIEHQFTYTGCGNFSWNGQLYTESGAYQQTFTSANGCDSIVTLHLNLIDAYESAFDTAVCESLVWYGHEYTQSGQYEHTFVTSNSCDSIVTMNLVVWQQPEPIPAILGLKEIFVSTEFVQNEYNYYIDPVPFATHYEWTCEDPDWIMDASDTHCTLMTTSPGTTILKVRAWNDYCGYTEQEIVINAGFFDIEDHPTIPISIYPNPANDKVFIKAKDIVSVKLFDLLGQCHITIKGDGSDMLELDTNSLTSNVYAIEITTRQGKVVRKLNVTR